jgi:ParB/RepB/Spo0J family partition protein
MAIRKVKAPKAAAAPISQVELSNTKVLEIPISMIIQEENSRTGLRDVEMHELMDSIRQHGLLQPIGVYPKGTKYSVVFGNRRLEAHKKLNRKFISAIIVPTEEAGKDFLLKNLTENLQRKDINYYELGRIANELVEKHNYSISEVAVSLSKPIGMLKDAILNYRRTPPKFRDKVKNMSFGSNVTKKGFIPANVAAKLATLVDRAALPAEDTEKLYELATKDNMLTLSDIGMLDKLVRAKMPLNEALKVLDTYEVSRPTIAIHKKDMEKIRKKYGHNFRRFFMDVMAHNKIVPFTHTKEIKDTSVEVANPTQPLE